MLEQNPEAGDEVEEDSTVDLVVSVGPEAIPVPDVVGLTEDEARAALAEAGFESIEIELVTDDEVEEGRVVEQVPEADADWPPTEAIVLRVSEGAETVEVPNIRGQAEADAIRILEGEPYGLVVEIERAENPDTPEGFVVNTRPRPGRDVEPGSVITIIVSAGPGHHPGPQRHRPEPRTRRGNGSRPMGSSWSPIRPSSTIPPPRHRVRSSARCPQVVSRSAPEPR